MKQPPPRAAHPTRARTAGVPDWQLPAGVGRGTWDYLNSATIAAGYAEFLREDPLAEADGELLRHYFPARDPNQPLHATPHIADFGCGAGRTLAPLLERGYRITGIDLSLPMLRQAAERLHHVRRDNWTLTQANLVHLNGIQAGVFDGAVCLFSTLGMIRGQANRREFLQQVRRLLKPGGQFLVHAHNLWYQARHPGGVRWLLTHGMQAAVGRREWGDRFADYRGVRRLMIHSFRRRELDQALNNAGLVPEQWWSVWPGRDRLLPGLPLLSGLRVVGWIVACRTEPGPDRNRKTI